jgi:hypothetical protein
MIEISYRNFNKIIYREVPNGQPAAAVETPPACDRWGNIKAKPERTIEENHGKNFIKIFIFQISSNFYYGFQFRIEKLVRQKAANIKGQPYETLEAARIAAREELKKIIFKTRSRGLKMLFADFVNLYYNQPELF